MDLILDSVNKIGDLLSHGGCDECDVILDTNPENVNCQYERGACMIALFGGKTADFVTYDPIRARTKISFMFGVPLDTGKTRSAASAIINVVTGFFSLTRVHHSCKAECHTKCFEELKREISGKRIKCLGDMPVIESELRTNIVENSNDADIFLINNDGLITEGMGNLFMTNSHKKRIICIGPSTAGVSRLQQIEHWCPYGVS